MTGEAHVPFTIGAITALGGLMGYVKTRSRISLAAGVAFGALFAVSGRLISQGEAEQGHALGFGSALVLAAVMGKRAVRTGKLMPAGLVAGIGATGAVYHGLKWKEWKQW